MAGRADASDIADRGDVPPLVMGATMVGDHR
jgi:hypothetical protein